MESEPTDPAAGDAQVPGWGRRRHPRRRWLRVLIALLVGVEALYLVAANLYLSSELADRTINRRPEKLLVSYDSAWSPWPGEVRVRGLRLRGQGRRLQWTATADRISGRIGLVPLLWKSFRASGVEGDRVIFRLRRREDRPLPKKAAEAAEADPGEPGDEALGVGTEGDPPIPGLENPPEPAPEEVYPPLDPDRRKWTVTLSDFDLARVSEVWIDRVRVRGEMTLADGGMTLKLKQSIRVHPSRFRLDGAHVLLDETPVADRVDGELLVSSEEFDHQENRGVDSIPFLLGEADLSARLAGLGWLNRYLSAGPEGSPPAGLRFGGGAGTLDVDAKLRAARFAPGSRLSLTTDTFAARFLDYVARGGAEVVWSVGAEDARMSATFADYRLARDGHDAPHVVGKGLALTLSEMGHDLPPALGEARVEIEIPPARVPELAFYDAYLPEAAGVTLRGGSATLRARFEARPAEGTGSGRLDLSSERVRATVRGEALSGALEVESRFPAIDLDARRFRLDGTRVTIRNARVAGAEDGGGKPWAGQVTVREGTLSPGAATLLRARATGAITDVRPVLHLFSAGDKLPDWVLDVFGIDDVQARTDVEVSGGRVTLRGLAARADDLTLDGELVLRSGKRRDGRLLLGYRGLHLGLDLQGGETDLKLLGARRWYESGR